MCCWFWCTKTSKGEGSIHPNTQRVHVMSFILLLNGSYSGKTHVITAEMISALSCYLLCIIPSTWGKCSRDTSGMKYFSLQREEIWEEYLKCEMILRIDIFNWAYMSYGNMKMLIYDSSKLTTGQKNRWVRCTLRSHNKRPCDGAWLFIPDQYPQRKSVFYLVTSVLSLYFGFFFSHSFNETFCVTSTARKSGLRMINVYCWGKLPKLNIKEAKIRRIGGA